MPKGGSLYRYEVANLLNPHPVRVVDYPMPLFVKLTDLGALFGAYGWVDTVNVVNADTEYSYYIPDGCRDVKLKIRDGTPFRIAYVTGKVAGPVDPYYTVPANTIHTLSKVNIIGGLSIYFACGVGNKVMEIEYWYYSAP